MINKLKAGQPPVIYGTDYPTPDGTCIRDYVDVRDIAWAHLAAADVAGQLPRAMNVGTGRGGSVREVIGLDCAAAGRCDAAVEDRNRRAGDSAFLCAEVSLAKGAFRFSIVWVFENSMRITFSEKMLLNLCFENRYFNKTVLRELTDQRPQRNVKSTIQFKTF